MDARNPLQVPVSLARLSLWLPRLSVQHLSPGPNSHPKPSCKVITPQNTIPQAHEMGRVRAGGITPGEAIVSHRMLAGIQGSPPQRCLLLFLGTGRMEGGHTGSASQLGPWERGRWSGATNRTEHGSSFSGFHITPITTVSELAWSRLCPFSFSAGKEDYSSQEAMLHHHPNNQACWDL